MPATQEPCDNDSSGTAPPFKLRGGAFEVAGVESPEHCRSPEGSRAKVKNKIDQCIEFILAELYRHKIVDAGRCTAHIFGQQGF